MHQPNSFPIVGLGASAGGLEALKSFFAKVPKDSGIAYVVVVHLTRKQPSLLTELLQRAACIPVSTAKDGQVIEPDRAYIIPPDKEIRIYRNKLQLLDILDRSPPLPIDAFLYSLAQDHGDRASAVILSGTGMDGSLGIREIHSHGGVVLVQTEESAGYDGMPGSAIRTGLVDMVLSPGEMPEKLVQYFAHHTATPDDERSIAIQVPQETKKAMDKIMGLLRGRLGHDFSAYKVNTVRRRITRRMGLNQIESQEKYVRYLRENPEEIDILFRELLIGVTSFFRDPESFEVLKNKGFPGLFKDFQEDGTFRVWVPGCSTGEEVYSLTMALHEFLDGAKKRVNLQLFGTDIDKIAIDKAREGRFPPSITGDVSDERLKRFFTRDGSGFRIRKEIRDCVIFSVQDVLRDPPFSRLNLLCCRNLLIYFSAEAQKKLLPVFHYTLNSHGILMLGSSETIGNFTSLFAPVNKKWKIYRHLEVPLSMRRQVVFPSGQSTPQQNDTMLPPQPVSGGGKDIGETIRSVILDQFAPASVLVSREGEILHVQGRVGKYLEPPSGPPTHNILDLAREGLGIELSSALRKAGATHAPVSRQGIAVKTNGDIQKIDLQVLPQDKPGILSGRFLVVFLDNETMPTSTAKRGSKKRALPTPEVLQSASERNLELERELQFTRETNQAIVEELESSNEELKSTNEELQSANEELQSSNEELESTKEELQSLNEELQTLNAELQSNLEELSASREDLYNLLNSTEIATVFVDKAMRIRRFTSESANIINLIDTDVGRPFEHVTSNLSYGSMMADLREVLEKLIPKEVEVQTTAGEWYRMRIMPYRTTDNRVDGAVLTFSCIDKQKKNQENLATLIKEIEATGELVRKVFDLNAEPLAVLDNNSTIVIANTAFGELVGISPEDEKTGNGIKILSPVDSLFMPSNPDFSQPLMAALKSGSNFQIDDLQLDSPHGKRTFRIEGIVIPKGEEDIPYRILLRFEEAGT